MATDTDRAVIAKIPAEPVAQIPDTASDGASAERKPSKPEGHVSSQQQTLADVKSEANNYATTKSVTQVIFTTSAIASNVTLWNQLDNNGSRYGALTTLIWISVALNAFVILLATYLSFQRSNAQPADKAAATIGGTHADSVRLAASPAQQPADVADKKPAIDHQPPPAVAVSDILTVKDIEVGTGGSNHPHQHKLWHNKSKKPAHANDPEQANVGGCCCRAGGTHSHYNGAAVELCGVKLYSRSNDEPSWACCDVSCCALFRVTGSGKDLGILSVKRSKKDERHFMDAKTTLLNEVIGILAVTIVIMNVIISALAANTK